MKILAYTNASGSSVWRIIDPLAELNTQYPDVEPRIGMQGIQEQEVSSADVVLLQSIVDKEGLAMIRAYQAEKGLKVVCDVDDFSFAVDDSNPFKKEHDITDAHFVIKKTLEFADAVITSTPYLAEQLKPYTKNIHVFENYMSANRWDVSGTKRSDDVFTIGYTGSITHVEDFKIVSDTLCRIKEEYKDDVRILTMGDTRFKQYLPASSECMLGVPMEFYPYKLASLGVDLGVAPLRDTLFNRCKSNIKALEYGLHGAPIFASDVQPYRDIVTPEVGLLVKDDGWYDAIKWAIESREKISDMGKTLQNRIKGEYLLPKHISRLYDIYKGIIES